jgi:hypothetical protein
MGGHRHRIAEAGNLNARLIVKSPDPASICLFFVLMGLASCWSLSPPLSPRRVNIPANILPATAA